MTQTVSLENAKIVVLIVHLYCRTTWTTVSIMQKCLHRWCAWVNSFWCLELLTSALHSEYCPTLLPSVVVVLNPWGYESPTTPQTERGKCKDGLSIRHQLYLVWISGPAALRRASVNFCQHERMIVIKLSINYLPAISYKLILASHSIQSSFNEFLSMAVSSLDMDRVSWIMPRRYMNMILIRRIRSCS